ncbi:MAG: DUF4375 domain-containing protein [Chloroflexota bacterium]
MSQLSLSEKHFESIDLAYDTFLYLLTFLEKETLETYNPKIKSLPQHWRAVYTTFWLECEIRNGGHHQFFWNSEGEFNTETLEDLKLINASEYVTIFSKALEVYDKHDYIEEKIEAGSDWERFTQGYREKRLDECDSNFEKANKTESIADVLTKYISHNKQLFIQE